MYIIITPFFPNSNNFRGSYLLDQAKEIQNQYSGEVKVLILDSFFSTKKNYLYENINCYVFKLIDFPSFFFPGFFQKLNDLRFLKFLKKNEIYLDNDSKIHGHINYPSLPFLKLIKNNFGCKTILQHHSLDVLQFYTGRIKSGFFKKYQNVRIKKYFLNHFDKIDFHIGVSNKVIEKLVEISPIISKKSFVLYNGVDLSKFFPKGQKSEKFKIGCVANFWKLKDQITLIKAIDLLVKNNDNLDLYCSFIGSGPTLNLCKKYVLTNDVPNIDFKNSLDHSDLNDFYNSINLFVLPSYYEALGCVYLESWATETPFIAVRNQGVEELLNDSEKQKHIIQKSNVQQLSQKILYFIETKEIMKFNFNLDIKVVISDFLKKILN